MRATSKAKKAALFLFSVAVLLAGGAAAVRGQSALDGFDPNANGLVSVVVVQPDGKVLIGGSFTTLSPNGGVAVTRNCIARLNPDGTLDTAFDPNANSGVNSIAVQADGKILAGGAFTSIGGQTRNYIARLDPVTGLADSFDPNANGGVVSIAVQADGKILAGGPFTSIGGQTRNNIARLDATTGLADSFNPNANSSVFSIALQADGKILVGGQFNGANSIGGQTRNYIARLDATTGLADSFDPNANGYVNSIALQADGKIVAGGFFSSVGGQTRFNLARLDATTGLADSFDPSANNEVYSIALQADGKILAGGIFNSIGGQQRHFIARVDAATGLADSFDPHANNFVYSIAVQADGKILAGGDFTTLSPNGGATVTRNHIARLETDGRLDQTLDLNTVGNFVLATAVQPDGKVIIGGLFSSVLGVTRNNIARLNTDGTLDTGFDPNGNGQVLAIATQSDGKILVGGPFTGIGGQMRNHIARLDATTGLADSWNPNASADVRAIVVQADGKILACGIFGAIGGQTRNSIARLDPATALADSFNPNAGNAVNAIALQTDGTVVAGGQFTFIGGQPRNFVARLNSTNGSADSWNPNADNSIFSIAIQLDGKILAGGFFNNIGGQMRNRIARLDQTTASADAWNPNANNAVYAIAAQSDGKVLAVGNFNTIGGASHNYLARLDGTTGTADAFDASVNGTLFSLGMQADGKILVGGLFSSAGGQTRNYFARLSNDSAALQNVAATQTTVTWTRSGSSPQFSRVTFESSNDNVSYTSLGNGTASGGNWTLSGLNFATGQSFYIRARGYYGSGEDNGSGSITESVRNAFIAGPTGTPTPTPPPSVSISGTVTYCVNPTLPPVPGVTMTLTGTTSGSTLTNASGVYTFSSLPSGGNYTVMPTKTALTPGSAGINTLDVIAIQRHYLNITLLTGCKLTAANVNGDGSINTLDVIAVQRFYLSQATGTANVGKYQFTPTSLSYSGITTDQTAQNYTAVVFGDTAGSTYVHRPEGPEGPSQPAAGDEMSSHEIAATVAAISLPDAAVAQSRSNFVEAVKTTKIDASNKLVGFQGDLTFDERVVTFQSQPVSNAGLTSGNWNVSGNVLAGAGPIRTLRISAYSNDFTPLSGSGTLFNLNMSRVSPGAQSTKLIWAAPPNGFIFIDADLNTQKPGSVPPLGKRK